MADDKTKRGAADRSKVASGEGYEVKYLAEKYKVPQKEVIAAVKRVGVSRTAVEKELKKAK